MKIDRTTSSATRGKFAHLCVEINLKKPLVPKIFIGGRWQKVEYEGLRMMCYHCGKFGHYEEGCIVRQKENEGYTGNQAIALAELAVTREKDYETHRFGPWMVARKNNKRTGGPRANATAVEELPKPSIASGSRFVVLEDEDVGHVAEEFTPVSENKVEFDQAVSKLSKTKGPAWNKELFKQNLQVSANVSNRDSTPASIAKGKQQIAREPKTVSSVSLAMPKMRASSEKIVTELPENNNADVSQVISLNLPKLSSHDQDIDDKPGVGVNDMARERQLMTMEESGLDDAEKGDVTTDMDLEDKVCRRLGKLNYFRVEADGYAGGIWVFWDPKNVEIDILAYSGQLVHMMVNSSKAKWLLTAVYGSPVVEERKRLWLSLNMASDLHNLPWMVIGDFNQVTSPDEKIGRTGVNLAHCNLTLDCMSYCNLSELETGCPKYTWWKKRHGYDCTRVRLDQGLANEERRTIYPHAEAFVLPRTHSDHHPILVRCTDSPLLLQAKKNFRFEEAWMTHPNFIDFLKTKWRFAEKDMSITLKGLADNLQQWSLETFGDIYKKKKRLLARLKGMQKIPDAKPSDYLQHLEIALIEEYNLALYQEELIWQQKVRLDWLKYGDSNSKFYHALVKSKQRKKKIVALRREDGSWCTDPKELEEMVVNYYQHLYKDDGLRVSLSVSPNWRLNDDQISDLAKGLSSEEIQHALFDMNPRKSTGYDGFPASFFQKNWQYINADLVNFVQMAYATGSVPPALNHTLITLIPKVESPEKITQFRPISLFLFPLN
ncbi:uncharacterized protein LOC110421316 [Herrania umbratica]|uniref:Uncharacterized protein LOC110421316 n=1 Tax=Herrania umbratica TaxID=108875 RepID=A0A6J1ATL5_9ROSI|nr:uncharacterized protein LOC110421316 [Herrania umbratica]